MAMHLPDRISCAFLMSLLTVSMGALEGCRTLQGVSRKHVKELRGRCSFNFSSASKNISGDVAIHVVPPYWVTIQLLDPFGMAMAIIEISRDQVRWIDLKSKCYRKIPHYILSDIFGAAFSSRWVCDVLFVRPEPGMSRIHTYIDENSHTRLRIEWFGTDGKGRESIDFNWPERQWRLELMWRYRSIQRRTSFPARFDTTAFDICDRGMFREDMKSSSGGR